MCRSCSDLDLTRTSTSGSNRGPRTNRTRMRKAINTTFGASLHLLSVHLDNMRDHEQSPLQEHIALSLGPYLRQGQSSATCLRSLAVFRTWGCPSRSSSPPRGPDCCQCPGPSWAAWCWPWSSAAAASRCRCSTPGSWWSSTSPRPCRSRCRGSWPSWARPAAAANASAWSRGTWCSGGRPGAGWPGRGSNTLRRPLKHNQI